MNVGLYLWVKSEATAEGQTDTKLPMSLSATNNTCMSNFMPIGRAVKAQRGNKQTQTHRDFFF